MLALFGKCWDKLAQENKVVSRRFRREKFREKKVLFVLYFFEIHSEIGHVSFPPFFFNRIRVTFFLKSLEEKKKKK